MSAADRVSQRLPSWLHRGLDRVAGGVTSAADAVNKLNAYIGEASPRHDLSTASWRAVWIARFGLDADGNPATINRAGVYALLDDIDACANIPGKSREASCNYSVDKVFEGMNAELGLPADNGWMTLNQMLQWLGRYPVNADDPPGERGAVVAPSDPSVIDDTDRMFASLTDDQIAKNCVAIAAATRSSEEDCRAKLMKSRADAKAKIDRLSPPPEGFMVSRDIAPPKPKPGEDSSSKAGKRAAGALVVPTALGALAALRWGWHAFAVGGAVGVVAAAGAFLWTKHAGK